MSAVYSGTGRLSTLCVRLMMSARPGKCVSLWPVWFSLSSMFFSQGKKIPFLDGQVLPRNLSAWLEKMKDEQARCFLSLGPTVAPKENRSDVKKATFAQRSVKNLPLFSWKFVHWACSFFFSGLIDYNFHCFRKAIQEVFELRNKVTTASIAATANSLEASTETDNAATSSYLNVNGPSQNGLPPPPPPPEAKALSTQSKPAWTQNWLLDWFNYIVGNTAGDRNIVTSMRYHRDIDKRCRVGAWCTTMYMPQFWLVTLILFIHPLRCAPPVRIVRVNRSEENFLGRASRVVLCGQEPVVVEHLHSHHTSQTTALLV